MIGDLVQLAFNDKLEVRHLQETSILRLAEIGGHNHDGGAAYKRPKLSSAMCFHVRLETIGLLLLERRKRRERL